MKVAIAIDSFKGSLTSLEAGRSAAEGIKRVFPQADISIRPLADGGEGTVKALTHGMGGRLEQVEVMGPIGRPVICEYGIIDQTKTAVIEMSEAAGITLLREDEKNPLLTTTYGVGEVIKDAIFKGCRHFIVGIGGSATNDGGIGMLQALGFEMLNGKGEQVLSGAQGLEELVTIGNTNVLPELSECSFRIACDVTNPLCGKNGCSAVFGPQKGGTSDMIKKMDTWLLAYAELVKRYYPNAAENHPGAGAAGGLGFAFLTFLNAALEPGVKMVLEETHLEDYIKDADYVITGEGRLDGQTIMGKAPIGVAQIAKKYQKTVIAFSGCVSEESAICNQYGIDAFFPILRDIVTTKEAMVPENAKRNLADTCEQVFKMIASIERL